MLTRYIIILDDEPKVGPLLLIVKAFDGKEGETSSVWIREAEMVMSAAIATNRAPEVVLAILKRSCRSREWALTCNASVDAAFPT